MTKIKNINPECTPLLSDDDSGFDFGYYMNCVKLFFYDWFPLMYMFIITTTPYIIVLICKDAYVLQGMCAFVFICCLLEILFIKVINRSCLQIYDICSYDHYNLLYIITYAVVYLIFVVYMDNKLFVTECSNYMNQHNIKNINCEVITRNCYCLVKYLNTNHFTNDGITNCNSNTFDYMKKY